MDKLTYEVESKVEASHWWFVGRRYLFSSIISSYKFNPISRVLDIGTSTGTNLRMMKELGFTNVRGLDLSDDAIQWCKEKGLGKVDKGDICNIPSAACEYDLVLATDIIEHVDDDGKALKEITRVLKPLAMAVITVPAFQSLWGLQDIVSHHKRRYRKEEFVKKLENAGLEIQECFYFNYFLFVPIWLARQLIKIFKTKLASENELNSKFINKILKIIFFIDIYSARKITPCFGVSLIAVVKKYESKVNS